MGSIFIRHQEIYFPLSNISPRSVLSTPTEHSKLFLFEATKKKKRKILLPSPKYFHPSQLFNPKWDQKLPASSKQSSPMNQHRSS